LPAFQSSDVLFVNRGNPRKGADEISVSAQDSIVLFHGLRQALNIRREQLQTLR
jgi:hypothetical protein